MPLRFCATKGTLIALLAAFAVAPVLAQQPAPGVPQRPPTAEPQAPPRDYPPAQYPGERPDVREPAGQQPAGEMETNATERLPFVRASHLMGAKITDSGGDRIGSLENLAINTHRGQVVYGVLGTGGFLRMGHKKFAVPWNAIEIRTGDRVVVDVAKQDLKHMSGFRGNAWPATADISFLRGQNERGGEYAQAGAEENAGNLPTYNVKGSNLIGRTVLNMDGDKLGTIRDLTVDPRTGRITYAVIASGGFLRIGDRLLPVPWQALDTRNDNVVRLDIQKARLETAPTFSKSDWSALANPDFGARIKAFYGAPARGMRMAPRGLEPRPMTGQPQPPLPPNSQEAPEIER